MLQRILAHAESEPGREVCGLLLGAGASRQQDSSLTVRAERSRGTPSSGAETALGSARSGPSTSLGANGEGGGAEDQWIAEAVKTPNIAPNRADSFEIDPAALFAALRAERAGGGRVIGHYHSHPNGSPTPSACDAAMAVQPGRLWLIVACREARMWREVPGGAVHGAFDPVELINEGSDDGCA